MQTHGGVVIIRTCDVHVMLYPVWLRNLTEVDKASPSRMSRFNENKGFHEEKEVPRAKQQSINKSETISNESIPTAKGENGNRFIPDGDSTPGSPDLELGTSFEREGDINLDQTILEPNAFEDQWGVEMDHDEDESETDNERQIVRDEYDEANESENDNEHDEGHEDEDDLASGYWSGDLVDDEGDSHPTQQHRGANLLRNLMQQGSVDLSDSNLLDVMQRIVGGMGDTSFGRQNSEYDHLIENLGLTDQPYLVLETLNELLERMLMMNGYTAERLIPAGRLAKAIVQILSDPRLVEELELHLVACRCLYNFLEVNQDFIHHALSNDVVKALVERISEITYIDLTEQALQTLEIISRDPRAHLLIGDCNGLQACLRNLDFLTIHAQRKCLTIFANACTNISKSRFLLVESAFPLLSHVVENYRDRLVIENAWLAMSRIIASYKQEPDYVGKLFENTSLLKQMVEIISKSCNPTSTESGLNFRTNIALLKSLNIISAMSIRISDILLDLNVGSQICSSLNRYKKEEDRKDVSVLANESMPFEKIVPIEAVIAAPKELLYLFLQLIESILPIPNGDESIMVLEKGNIDADCIKERVDFFKNCEPTKFWNFINTVWPVLIHSFQGSMDIDVRREVLICVFMIVSYAHEANYRHVEGFASLSGILVSVTSSSRKVFSTDFIKESLTSNMSLAGLKLTLSLFYVFLILKNIMGDMQPEFFRSLERDGLFNDLFFITDNIESISCISPETDVLAEDPDGKLDNTPLTSFFNRGSPHEIFRRVESPLFLKNTFRNMMFIGKQLRTLYQEYKDLNVTHVTDNVLLSEIIQRLSSTLPMASVSEWDNIWMSLKCLLDSGDGGLSTFELMSLGLIYHLKSLLKNNGVSNLSSSDFSSNCKSSFVRILYSDNGSISRIIHILEDSLSRRESFDVYTSGDNATGNPINSAASMAKQVKIKLVPNQSNNEVLSPGMETFNISVHAIATFKSIGTFLLNHFKVNSKGPNGGAVSLQQISESDEEMSENEGLVNVDFFLNEDLIPEETTVFGAIFKGVQTTKNVSKVDPGDIWLKQHVILYKVSDSGAKQLKKEVFFKDDSSEFCDTDTGSIFALLAALFELNEVVKQLCPNYCALLPESFRNWNLTVKLNRQLEDLLIVASGTLPNWCIRIAKDFPFLLPLETKILFLQSTSFGCSRLIHNWQLRSLKETPDEFSRYSFQGANAIGRQIGRPSRIKARISRDRFFTSAMRVLQFYAKSPDVLEIEYYDEAGSGLGPTLEFYSTTSKEFCKRSLHLWRDDGIDTIDGSDNGEYVISNTGLFPRPLHPRQIDTANGTKILFLFSQLGKFIARALIDSRMVDFNFNCVFLAMIRALQLFDGDLENHTKNEFELISVLKLIDPKLSMALEKLKLYRNCSDVTSQRPNDVDIEDLSLSFVLPGYPTYELIPNGADTIVTSGNVDLYISKVVENFVFRGVYHQVKAFVNGFSEVFPISSLSIFTSDDLNEIFGSSQEDWSREALADAIKPNHGYNQDSVTIERLINVLIDLSIENRRKFLKFLTGSPRLPIGGFKSMRPEFTVVRKYAEDDLTSDDYLPSVMTCVNYLKLPDYSLESIMYSKLIEAITEGADAFHLS